MANSKAKVKLKVTTVKGQAIKPKMGKGTGGIIPVSLKMKVQKDMGNKQNG